MRYRAVYWGYNTHPVDLFGVTINPPTTLAVPYEKAKLKVVDHMFTTTILQCSNCNSKLLDDSTLLRLPAYSCSNVECLDYDLCEKCVKLLPHEHPMYIDTAPPIEMFRGETVVECLLYALTSYTNRPMIGVCEGDGFKWHTYGDVYTKVRQFASGLLTLDLQAGNLLSICAKNSMEYVVADYACILCGITVVPIHVPFGQYETDHIVKSTESKCVVCSADVTAKFLKSMEANPCLKYIIQIEPASQTTAEVLEKAKSMNVTILYFDDILAKGSPESFVPANVNPDDLFSLTFTSGSTGVPKGVMVSNKCYAKEIKLEFSKSYIGVCFSPYAHSARQNMIHGIFCGGRVGITSGNMENLIEEIGMIQPTGINGVPRFWNMLYTQYTNEVAALEQSEPECAPIASALVAEKFRKMFGNNLRVISSGGAPTGEAVLKFMKQCFSVVVVDGYGSTEAGSITTNYELDTGVEVKLEDWGDYKSTDTPYPRGEICVKTDHMAYGYWKDEKTTAEAFRDGWFHTGDIGEQRPDKLKIIDRKKNVFKLAQGEFVSPEHLENTFIESNFVDQIFITGNTLKSYLVAVAVPNKDTVKSWAQQRNILFDENSFAEVIHNNKELLKEILSDFARIGMKAKIPSFQVPRALHLNHYLFTEQNQLMTASNKINRINLEKEFKSVVAELYEKSEELESMPMQTDKQILHRILSEFAPGIAGPDESIFGMGVDSLSAVQITQSIKQHFNVYISLHDLYINQTQAKLLELLRNARINIEVPKPASKSITSILIEDAELPDDIVPSYIANNIFLTGATGFLGVYLLLELLKQTPAKIYCLVRAGNETEAAERLKKNFEYYRLNHGQYESRVISVVGDLTKPGLGIEPSIYNSLADNLDLIYHCAAMVNGIYPYEAHKAHNVNGTLEIIRLASKGRYKILHHISTLSIFRSGSSYPEDFPLIRSGFTSVGGYGQSKWVAESLCEEARKKGVDINVYRFGTISGDSETGRAHTSDFINRLIGGLAFMGIYPAVSADVEMTPVDYAAKACIYISLKKTKHNNFHVVSPHPATTLKELAAVIQNFGYKMQRVRYAVWKDAVTKTTKNPLYGVTSYFNGDFPSSETMQFANAKEALKDAPFECPSNMDEWIKLYLRELITEKIIKEPGD